MTTTDHPNRAQYEKDLALYKEYEKKLGGIYSAEERLRRISAFFIFCVTFFICAVSIDPEHFGEWILSCVSFSYLFSAFLYNWDFLINILTLGSISRLDGNGTELSSRKMGLLSNSITPYEQRTYDNYSSTLKDIYENRLYKKRANNPAFEGALNVFRQTLKDAEAFHRSAISGGLGFKEAFAKELDAYWSYAFGRQYVAHTQEKPTGTSSAENSYKAPTADANDLILRPPAPPEVKKVPPEKKYRSRLMTIDAWQELARRRIEIGSTGESLVLAIEQEYLESVNRGDLASMVKYVGDNVGLGYDVLSYFENGDEKYIEVKSTSRTQDAPFYMTRNELDTLNNYTDKYFIYRVELVDGGAPLLNVLSASDIEERYELSPATYEVKARS